MVARPHNQHKASDAFEAEDSEDIHILTREEAWELFEQDARRQLGISGEEFLRRWDDGEYRDIQDDPPGWRVMRVAMMIPTVRATEG
jgi:hypothetical protein